MNKTPSQPDLEVAEPDFDSSRGTAIGRTPVQRGAPISAGTPLRKPSQSGLTSSPAEKFGDKAAAIRRDTGRLSVRTVLKMQLAMDPSMSEFPESAHEQWSDIITELMMLGKANIPADFHIRLRELIAEEDERPIGEKLLFLPRLASWLNGKTFAYKVGTDVKTWKVERCSVEDLSSLGPKIMAREEGSFAPDRVWFFQIMAGLRISSS